MKNFKVHVVDMRSVDFTVAANSKKEAAEKVVDILDNTDLIENSDAEYSASFQLFETENEQEDMCNADCNNCLYEYDDECLLDELY